MINPIFNGLLRDVEAATSRWENEEFTVPDSDESDLFREIRVALDHYYKVSYEGL